jgi:hypothetical protein
VQFYLPETVDLEKAQHEAFQYMGYKHRHWKHTFKDTLEIQPGDTPLSIHARVDAKYLAQYDTAVVEHLLGAWCTEKKKVHRS